jgi:HPt (histidine-containing phosphotransfer) domain-containing protein
MNEQLLPPKQFGAGAIEPGAGAPLDFQQLLNRCLGNVALAERLLSNFGKRFEADLSQLQHGLQANDSQQVARVAHQLKGAAANLAAVRLQRISAEIEHCGRADCLHEVDDLLAQLRGEWERFVEFRTSQSAGFQCSNN